LTDQAEDADAETAQALRVVPAPAAERHQEVSLAAVRARAKVAAAMAADAAVDWDQLAPGIETHPDSNGLCCVISLICSLFADSWIM
jgi:hypothetical protein